MNSETMNCEEIRRIIEDLSPQLLLEKASQTSWKEHLAACSACRELYERTISFNSLLNQWKAPQPQRNIQAQVLARIAQQEKDQADRALTSNFWGQLTILLGYRFRVPAFAALLIAAILLASITYNLILLNKSDRPVQMVTLPEPTQKPLDVIVKSTQGLLEPTPFDTVVGSQQVRFDQSRDLSGIYQYGTKYGLVQPALVVILGAPITLGRATHFPEKIITMEELNQEEGLP
jgi:hypothetical protein